MNKGITLVIYPVKDLAKAKTLYSNFLGINRTRISRIM